MLPPSFAQRSASSRASEPPAITLSAGRGSASDAHWVPQRQQVFSWRAIGALQDRHTRGKWRSRILATFRSADTGHSILAR
jgi:hypothetical protein